MQNFSVRVINANELAAVEMLSNNLKRGAAVRVTLYKETKMNKRGNPFLGRVTERTIIGGWSVGTDYSTSCNNAAERSGSTETFIGKESWHRVYNEFFNIDKATESKFYLQLQRSAAQGAKSETTYYLDGLRATDEEVAQIKAFIPIKKHAQSSSQVEAGIDESRERFFKCIALANIESIEQGSFTYTIERTSEAVAAVESE